MIPRWHKENIDTDISQLTSLIQEILIYVDRRQRADLIDDLPIFSLIQQRKSTLSTGGPISIVTRLSSRSIAFIDMVITTGWVDWCITVKLFLDFVANPFGRSTGFFLNLAHVFDHKVSTLNLWGVFTYKAFEKSIYWGGNIHSSLQWLSNWTRVHWSGNRCMDHGNTSKKGCILLQDE